MNATRVLALVLAAGLLASCATTKVVREPGVAAAWLGGSPRVVVRLDARQVKAWGQVTKSREALKTVGERTTALWMAFDLDSLDALPRAADGVRLVLEGDYPRGGASFLLDWNPAWKRDAQAGTWTNDSLGFTVSLPEEGLVAVRRHDSSPPQAATGVLRDLNPVVVESTAVWASFWEPGEALFGAAGAALLPIRRLDLVLGPVGEDLEGELVLHFDDPRVARAAAVMLKLLGPQIRARLGQDLTWTAEDTQLVGRPLRFRQEDLRSLAETLVTDPQEDQP